MPRKRKASSKWIKRHVKVLAWLVGKYGVEGVVQKAQRVPTPQPGRAPDPELRKDVVWIEREARRIKKEKKSWAYGAIKRATRERFNLKYGPPKSRTAEWIRFQKDPQTEKKWKSFQKRIKNARDHRSSIARWNRELREYDKDLLPEYLEAFNRRHQ